MLSVYETDTQELIVFAVHTYILLKMCPVCKRQLVSASYVSFLRP